MPASYGGYRDPVLRGQDGSSLCRSCNLNQSLKIHQLARFKPSRPENYDDEVELFAAHLERVYRLCRTCEASIHQVLGEQDATLKAKLLAWRLEATRQTAAKSKEILRKSLHSAESTLPLRLTMAVMALLAYVFIAQPPYLLIDDQDNSLLSLVKQAERWFGPLELVSSAVFIALFSITRSRPAPTVLRLITLMLWLIFLFLIVAHRFDVASVPEAWAFIVLLYSVSNVFYAPRVGGVVKLRKHAVGCRETSQPIPALHGSVTHGDGKKKLLNSYRATDHGITWPATQDNSNHPKQETDMNVRQNDIQCQWNQDLVDDSPCDISTLSIDGESSRNIADMMTRADSHRSLCSSFSVKSYDGLNSSGINFGESHTMCNRKSLLRPAKFKLKPPSSDAVRGVIRASWVAGGYWHTGEALDHCERKNLSRSSSQSSGFVSQGSANKLFLPPLAPDKQQRQVNKFRTALAGQEICLDSDSLRSEPIFNSTMNANRLNGDLFNFNTVFNDHGTKGTNSVADSSLDSAVTEKEQTYKVSSNTSAAQDVSKSFLEREIRLKCSMYSCLLATSVVINVSLLLVYVLYAP